MEKGKLIIFSAPSGAGKTTIVKHLIEKGFDVEFSISACNRKARKNEEHGKDYYFLTSEDFKEKIKNNEFVEWEEVYNNQFYGTLHSELERIWKKGKHAIFDIDVKGGVKLKKQFGKQAFSVFVMPPSVEELAKRLKQRDSDSEEQIKKRIAKANEEMTYAKNFDYVLINKELDIAKNEIEKVITNFLDL